MWQHLFSESQQYQEYEDDECDINKLEALINQEAEEIESSNLYIEKSLLAKQTARGGFHDIKNRYRTKFGNSENLMDNEVDPEFAAKMLNSQTHGDVIKHSPPSALYGRLFPEDKSLPKIMVTAAKKKRGAVLPLRSSFQHQNELMVDMDPGVVDYYELAAMKSEEEIPEPIKHEADGDEDEILGLTESYDATTLREPFNYIVSSDPVLYGNYVQLRGSVPPLWFPGFFTVNPKFQELQCIDEPHEALEKAWRTMSPTHVASPYGNILLGKQ